MKTLIAFASKTGTAAKCADMLADKIPKSTLCDLKGTRPDPSGYDIVIVGGSIRAGVLSGETREYLEGCAEILAGKRLGLFICCGSDEDAEQAFERNIPEKLLETAICHMAFGGEIEPSRARGFEKMMMKIMVKSAQKDGKTMKLFPERITEFAAKMLENETEQ